MAALVLGVLMSLIYPLFNNGLTSVGKAVDENSIVGGGIYGTANKLLIPLGLHHILNSVVWFILGDYSGAHGDLNRFFAGDPEAGIFMTGFFPIMMFALLPQPWPSGAKPAPSTARPSAASCSPPDSPASSPASPSRSSSPSSSSPGPSISCTPC